MRFQNIVLMVSTTAIFASARIYNQSQMFNVYSKVRPSNASQSQNLSRFDNLWLSSDMPDSIGRAEVFFTEHRGYSAANATLNATAIRIDRSNGQPYSDLVLGWMNNHGEDSLRTTLEVAKHRFDDDKDRDWVPMEYVVRPFNNTLATRPSGFFFTNGTQLRITEDERYDLDDDDYDASTFMLCDWAVRHAPQLFYKLFAVDWTPPCICALVDLFMSYI